MNRDKAVKLTDKIKQALQGIEELENFSISYNGTFSSGQMKLNMTITEKNSEKMESMNFELSKKYGFTQKTPKSKLFHHRFYFISILRYIIVLYDLL